MSNIVTDLNQPKYLDTVKNLITGTQVTLSPPFPYFGDLALATFLAHFNTWCQSQWILHQGDTSLLVNKALNWPDSDAIMPSQQSAGITTPPGPATAAP